MGRYVGVKRLASNYSLAVLLPGIAFVPEAPWGRATRWRTVITVDSEQSAPPGPPIPSASSGQAWGEAIRLALEAENIESRPLWLLCHQPTTPPATCGYLVSPPAPQPFDPAQLAQPILGHRHMLVLTDIHADAALQRGRHIPHALPKQLLPGPLQLAGSPAALGL